MSKHYNQQNVYEAARARLEYVYKEFPKVYVSFSGGKDSGVLLNMAIEVAREQNRLPVQVLYIDLEAQYQHTIDYITRMTQREEVNVHWVCLPIRLRNAVSQFQPHWFCWDPDKQSSWVRNYPEAKGVITDPSYFSFFRPGMEFEDFVTDYGNWFADGEDTACLVGIRSDESLNRFRTIKNKSKQTWQHQQWSTQASDNLYNFYPLYDWRVDDIWVANGKFRYQYNKVYDLMYMAGVPLSKQRICQPFGDDQRKGLFLYKILEPETWSRVVSRVEGANFGNRYSESQKTALGDFKINLPEGYTYETYAYFLLSTMPPYLKDHYLTRINKFINWWRKQGVVQIPNVADTTLEARKAAPSWRRVCKVLLKNDYWCTGLSFSRNKKEMEKQQRLILKYMQL